MLSYFHKKQLRSTTMASNVRQNRTLEAYCCLRGLENEVTSDFCLAPSFLLSLNIIKAKLQHEHRDKILGYYFESVLLAILYGRLQRRLVPSRSSGQHRPPILSSYSLDDRSLDKISSLRVLKHSPYILLLLANLLSLNLPVMLHY